MSSCAPGFPATLPVLPQAVVGWYHLQALMRFPHIVRPNRPCALLIFSGVVSLCLSFNVRLDASSYTHGSVSLAEPHNIGAEVTTAQAHALANSVAIRSGMPFQAKTRAKRPSVSLDALPAGAARHQPASWRFPSVLISSNAYSNIFYSRPQGRAPPHAA